MQVQSLAQPSGLRILRCHCFGLGLLFRPDPWAGIPYAIGWPKKKTNEHTNYGSTSHNTILNIYIYIYYIYTMLNVYTILNILSELSVEY